MAQTATATCTSGPCSGPYGDPAGNWTEGAIHNGEETFTHDTSGYVIWWDNDYVGGVSGRWVMSVAINSSTATAHWVGGTSFTPEGTFTGQNGATGTVNFEYDAPSGGGTASTSSFHIDTAQMCSDIVSCLLNNEDCRDFICSCCCISDMMAGAEEPLAFDDGMLLEDLPPIQEVFYAKGKNVIGINQQMLMKHVKRGL
jgi:hypothetical protein